MDGRNHIENLTHFQLVENAEQQAGYIITARNEFHSFEIAIKLWILNPCLVSFLSHGNTMLWATLFNHEIPSRQRIQASDE